MTDEFEFGFTPEEISQQARGNVGSFYLAAILYVKANDLPLEDFWKFMGEKFAPSWELINSPYEMMRSMALNMVSCGSRLESISTTESSSSAVVSGWPIPEIIHYFDVTPEEADSLFDIFIPIARFLNFNYQWQREDDTVTMTVSTKC